MGTFRFSLEQVLVYREQQEDEASVQYARCRAELLEAQTRLKNLEQQALEHEQQRLNERMSDASTFWLHEQYSKGLREDIVRQNRHVEQLASMTEEARLHLVACAKERKILEKLKEKRAKRHAQEERYAEQKSYDETAQIRYKPQAF